MPFSMNFDCLFALICMVFNRVADSVFELAVVALELYVAFGYRLAKVLVRDDVH